MGCTIKIILIIVISTNLADSITHKKSASSYPKDFRRHAGPKPPTDWEPGLREAAHQALIRERNTNPTLRDNLLHAPIIGRQFHASPFGDIAILARGQLYSSPSGFEFVQDPYQNDCVDCHERPCRENDCATYKSHGPEELVALWTVKRIRHRDPDFGHRYELEYTISPTHTLKGGYITRKGLFNYSVPGHVFIVKISPKGPAYNIFKVFSPEKEDFITNANRAAQWYKDSNKFRPIASPPIAEGSPTAQSSDLHFHKPNNYVSGDRLSHPRPPPHRYLPQTDNYIPVHYIPKPTQETQIIHDADEIELYKNLVHSLSQKTSTPNFVVVPTKSTYPHRFHPPTKGTTPLTHSTYPAIHPTTTIFHSTNGPSTTIHQHTLPADSFVPIQPPYTTPSLVPVSIITTRPTVSTLPPKKTTLFIPASELPSTHYTYTTTDGTRTTKYLPPQTYSPPTEGTKYVTQHVYTPTHYIPTTYQTTKPNDRPTAQTYYTTQQIFGAPSQAHSPTASSLGPTKPIPTFYIDPTHNGYPKTTPTTPFAEEAHNATPQKPFTGNSVYVHYSEPDPTYHPSSTHSTDYPSHPPHSTGYPSHSPHPTDYNPSDAPHSTEYHSPSPHPTDYNPDGHTNELHPTEHPPTHLPINPTRYIPPSTPHYIDLSHRPTKPFHPIHHLDEDEEEDLELFPEDKTKGQDTFVSTESSIHSTISPKPTGPFLLSEDEYTPKQKDSKKLKEDVEVFERTTPDPNKKSPTVTTHKINTKEIDEVFGNYTTNKPEPNESEFDEFFSDKTKRSTTPAPEGTTKNVKIIYENFYVASTENAKLETLTTTEIPIKHTNPPTSQSYSTSVSFEVNKPNKTELKYDKVKYKKAKVTEIKQGLEDFTIYKAEPENTEITTNRAEINTNKAFDDLALSLVNHARSLDYLEAVTKKPKYKRKSYKRVRKLRKRVEENVHT